MLTFARVSLLSVSCSGAHSTVLALSVMSSARHGPSSGCALARRVRASPCGSWLPKVSTAAAQAVAADVRMGCAGSHHAFGISVTRSVKGTHVHVTQQRDVNHPPPAVQAVSLVGTLLSLQTIVTAQCSQLQQLSDGWRAVNISIATRENGWRKANVSIAALQANQLLLESHVIDLKQLRPRGSSAVTAAIVVNPTDVASPLSTKLIAQQQASSALAANVSLLAIDEATLAQRLVRAEQLQPGSSPLV